MNIKWPFWKDEYKLLVDRNDGTHAERVEAYPPVKLMTDNDGPYSRLRVDVAQTSFWAGREFRAVHKFTVASNATYTVRMVHGANTVLYDLNITVEDSDIEMTSYLGGTATGPWTSVEVQRQNTMTTTPIVTSQTTVDYDGAHTGGSVIDIVRVPANNKFSALSGPFSERGLAPGTYYHVIQNTGNQTATVVFSAHWEERV